MTFSGTPVWNNSDAPVAWIKAMISFVPKLPTNLTITAHFFISPHVHVLRKLLLTCQAIQLADNLRRVLASIIFACLGHMQGYSYLHKLFKLLPFKTLSGISFLLFSLAKWSLQPFFQSVKFATDHIVCSCILWHKLQWKWLFFLDTNKLSALALIFLLHLSKHSLRYLYSWFSLSDSSSLSSVPNLISLMSIFRMPFRILASKDGKTIFYLWMFAISY